ncbi:MAG: phosphopyruvate hydratase [Bacilli bacterium]
MVNIKDLIAREILDSRGNPTIEVDMVLENGVIGTASVPSGASTGSREALELRDNDESRYLGKGVLKAIDNVNNVIKPNLIGKKVNQGEVDKILLELDGTKNKEVLGANAILGVSLACLKCLAISDKKDLFEYVTGGKVSIPIPMVNIINGGKHADNSLDIQEFMIIPVVKTIKERVRVASEVFHNLKKILKDKGYNTNVGDEGGFAPNLSKTTDAFDVMMEAIKVSGYKPGVDVFIGIDAAASEFYDKSSKTYNIDGTKKSADELIKYYIELVKLYPILSIEDPFYEDDFESFATLTRLIGNKIMLIGDDVFVTNEEYLSKGINMGAGNAILLKANQIGTISEMIKTILVAKKNNYRTVISHRSGETDDTFIADFAVGLNIPFIKTGSICRGERVSKYNRLMKIEEKLTKN